MIIVLDFERLAELRTHKLLTDVPHISESKQSSLNSPEPASNLGSELGYPRDFDV